MDVPLVADKALQHQQTQVLTMLINWGKTMIYPQIIFIRRIHSDNATSTQRENILPESRYFTNSTSNSASDTDSHSANMAFDIEIDSTFLVNVRPSFRFSKSMTTFERQEASRDEDNVLTNQSETASFVENIGKNFGNDLSITKRFGANGALLGLISMQMSTRPILTIF